MQHSTMATVGARPMPHSLLGCPMVVGASGGALPPLHHPTHPCPPPPPPRLANMWGGAWVGGVVQGVQPCGGPPHATHHVLGYQRACIGHFTWPWGAIAPPQPPMHLLNFKLWWVHAPPQVQVPTVGPRAPWPLHIVWGWPLTLHGPPRPHCGAKNTFAPISHFKILSKMCMP